MVRKVAEPREAYQCEKCGHIYPVMEDAIRCESNPVTPFKYEIGDIVRFEVIHRLRHSPSILEGVVERRWISGLPRDDEPAHGNVYKLRTIGKGRGLIACRFEDQITQKVGKRHK